MAPKGLNTTPPPPPKKKRKKKRTRAEHERKGGVNRRREARKALPSPLPFKPLRKLRRLFPMNIGYLVYTTQVNSAFRAL